MLDNSDELTYSVKLSAKPWDISIVDSKTAIVTLQRAKQLEVFPRLTEGRPMQLDMECWDVLVTGDKILTSCHNDPGEAEIKILDLGGHLLQQLGINRMAHVFSHTHSTSPSVGQRRRCVCFRS